MPPKTSKPKTAADEKRLIPPKNGAVVRMYRIGHGDCFLLAFHGKSPNRPSYVLIDCGYKPGSPEKIVRPAPRDVNDIVADIAEATGGEIDVAIITHEHQDHVNGITKQRFDGKKIKIKQTWLAWTEDSSDDVANALRKKFKDKLIGLVAARDRLAADGNEKEAQKIDEFLAFELGGDDQDFNIATATAFLAAAGGISSNKASMKILKDLAREGVKFIRPHQQILPIPGAKNARVFALGPPRDEDQILDVDPKGSEEFHGLAASAADYFASAFNEKEKRSPFAAAFCLRENEAFKNGEYGGFFQENYGSKATDKPELTPELKPESKPPTASKEIIKLPLEISGDAPWRRIDNEWLYSALQLAIDVNNATNNTSLVLAFEIGKGGKVLLFAADAQRGNWISWADKDWSDAGKKISTKDLLGRTVLYKVGHHGSHNATLNGLAGDKYPNLGWMGQGEYGREFTSMITAVRKWAETQKGWDHPLKAIKDALLKKCAGRVFQTDTDLENMPMPEGESKANWKKFKERVRADNDLFFDYRIEP